MASRVSSRFLTFILAVRNMLASGARRHPPESPRRILIIHHLLLGDTIMLTPLLAKLRQNHPAAEIVMAAPKAVAPLYAGQPYGVKAMPYDPKDIHTLRALYNCRGFDLALVPGDNRFSWVARALNANWVVAFADDIPAWKNWPVDQLVPYPQAPATWGDMVAELAVGPAPQHYRTEDWPAPAFALFNLPKQPYCMLHVGASSALKLWGREKWLVLANKLENRGYLPIWSGGRGEDRLVSAIDPEGKYTSFAGKLDLPQLWHLLAHASLLVCPDTGVAHLGRLTKTPTVTLFGPGSAIICGKGDFWHDSTYRAVTAEIPCRDQNILFRRKIDWVRRCGRDTDECASPRCMEAVSVEMALEAADQLLGTRV